jgi:hypothetical protein
MEANGDKQNTPQEIAGHVAAPLAPHHERDLVIGSAIAPDIIASRGVRTIRYQRELPPTFSQRQRRRGPGILFDSHRPNGEITHMFRPDRTDPSAPGHKYEQPSKHYGGPGNTLDVHPRERHLIGMTSVPVIFVEGIKKADALRTALRTAGVRAVVVAIAGVWNFVHDGRQPIPDMFDIPVTGRRATVIFDSDMLRKPSVQEAAKALAEHLKDRGADVRITYLADGPDGAKTGADDFLAAGGTVEELRLLTRRYDPTDFASIRMSRDERLRAGVDNLRANLAGHPWPGVGGHSRRAVYEHAIEQARNAGKIEPNGVRVEINQIDTAEGIGTTRQTVGKALRLLEADDGLIRKITDSIPGVRAASYVLICDVTPFNIGCTNPAKTATSLSCHERPPVPTMLKRVTSSADELDELKKMRWPYVKRTRTPEGHEYEYVARLGKIDSHALRKLLDLGGAALVADVIAAMNRTDRPARFVERHFRKSSEAGIVVVSETGDAVRLADDWLSRLREARALADEYKAERLQREAHKRARKAFKERGRTRADKAPTEREMDRRGKLRQVSPHKPEAAPVSGLAAAIRDHLSRSPHDAAQKPLGLASLLWSRDLYPIRPGVEDVRAAFEELGGDEYKMERIRESHKGPSPKVPREHPSTRRSPRPSRVDEEPPREPAPVAPPPASIPVEEELLEPPESWLSHPLDCECVECMGPLPTRYARPIGAEGNEKPPNEWSEV